MSSKIIYYKIPNKLFQYVISSRNSNQFSLFKKEKGLYYIWSNNKVWRWFAPKIALLDFIHNVEGKILKDFQITHNQFILESVFLYG